MGRCEIRAHESGLNASPRLSLKLRETGCRSYAEYLVRVQRDRTGESLIASIARAVRNRSKIHIWCAASSTGEEPYTLAFSLLDSLGPVAYKSCPILATDISTRALGLADQGIYSSAHLEALPPDWALKYTLRDTPVAGPVKVKTEVRRMVEFQRLNLIQHTSL